MEDATAHNFAETKSESQPIHIKVDGILLLTGMLGLTSLVIFWMSAIASAALIPIAAYFAFTDDVRKALAALAVSIVSLIACVVARWVARGFLNGHKGRAVVGCIMMALYGAGAIALMIPGISAGSVTLNAAGAVLMQALSALGFAVLVIVSFHNRTYWSKKP